MAISMKVSPIVKRAIALVLESKDAPESFKKDLRIHENDSVSEECVVLPYQLIRQLYDYVHSPQHSHEEEKLYFHEFLEGCELYFAPPKQPERNPELVARLERLKKEQENKRYQEMTSNIQQEIAGTSSLAGIGKEVRSVKKQLMGVLNFILTIVGSFTFGYMAAYYAGQSITARVFIGLFLALITAAADLYFIIKTEV